IEVLDGIMKNVQITARISKSGRGGWDQVEAAGMCVDAELSGSHRIFIILQTIMPLEEPNLRAMLT
ncbi:hypothetical protein FRC17_004768, partial [Serendipita sp. 399]